MDSFQLIDVPLFLTIGQHTDDQWLLQEGCIACLEDQLPSSNVEIMRLQHPLH